jgi:glycosyltransferase involved in cell wall biosynthesis
MNELNTPLSLKYFRNKFRGVSFARNIGIKNSEGEFVVFLGDDVHPEKDLLKVIMKIFLSPRIRD